MRYLDLREGCEVNAKDEVTEDPVIKPNTVVVFVGGCTYDEYSAIRRLSLETGQSYTVESS